MRSIISVSSFLLTPQVLNLALRLLLAVSLAPSFFTATAESETRASREAGSIVVTASLRLIVLQCLVATVDGSGRQASGFLDHAAHIFRQGLISDSEAIRAICRQGMSAVEVMARPVVPPLLRSSMAQMDMQELAGGPVHQVSMEHVEHDSEPATLPSGDPQISPRPAPFQQTSLVGANIAAILPSAPHRAPVHPGFAQMGAAAPDAPAIGPVVPLVMAKEPEMAKENHLTLKLSTSKGVNVSGEHRSDDSVAAIIPDPTGHDQAAGQPYAQARGGLVSSRDRRRRFRRAYSRNL